MGVWKCYLLFGWCVVGLVGAVAVVMAVEVNAGDEKKRMEFNRYPSLYACLLLLSHRYSTPRLSYVSLSTSLSFSTML